MEENYLEQEESNKDINNEILKMQKILDSFKIEATVQNVTIGPVFTIYEIKLSEGVSISKLKAAEEDILLNLQAKNIEIVVIPEKGIVEVRAENVEKKKVEFKELIESKEFSENNSNLQIVLGKDIYGNNKVLNLEDEPHILISGTMDSGKREFIHVVINSIIYKNHIDDVKFFFVDTTASELAIYNDIPNLLIPIVNDLPKAYGAVSWLEHEMENRFEKLSKLNSKTIDEYNEIVENPDKNRISKMVVIISDLADLIQRNKFEVESLIYNLTQRAHRVGMYLIILTEIPSASILTEKLMANIPVKIAFKLQSKYASNAVLTVSGAENLIGNGDLLLKENGKVSPVRYTVATISNKEIIDMVKDLKENVKTIYDNRVMNNVEQYEQYGSIVEEEEIEADPFLKDAVDIILDAQTVSTPFIQRKFRIGYARAGRILDQLEKCGMISEYRGTKPREIFITKERWQEIKDDFDFEKKLKGE